MNNITISVFLGGWKRGNRLKPTNVLIFLSACITYNELLRERQRQRKRNILFQALRKTILNIEVVNINENINFLQLGSTYLILEWALRKEREMTLIWNMEQEIYPVVSMHLLSWHVFKFRICSSYGLLIPRFNHNRELKIKVFV